MKNTFVKNGITYFLSEADMKQIAEIKKNIAHNQKILDAGGIPFAEQTMIELYIQQWKKDIKRIKYS